MIAAPKARCLRKNALGLLMWNLKCCLIEYFKVVLIFLFMFLIMG